MNRFFRISLFAVLVGGVVVAQQPAQKVAKAEAKAEVKAAPTKAAEPLQLKTYTLSGLEANDVSQMFTLMYTKLAGKEHAAPKTSMMAKNKTLFVRGTKEQLEAADAAIKLLQGDATGAKGQHVVALKAARADEVMATLQALDLGEHVVVLRASNTLVVLPAADGNMEQIKKVVEAAEKPEAADKAGKVEKPTTAKPKPQG